MTITSRIPVAVLGATGAVGQAFVRQLADHPWFVLAEVAASERSAGKSYRDATHWLEGTLPDSVANLTVLACSPTQVSAPIVFSALDSSVAGDVETAFAQAGRLVLSNAKNFRMAADVPLVIPEVNGDHLALLAHQQSVRGWSGAIVTNANCAATVIASALAPLHAAFGVRQVLAVTMQAVSGAGYPGVPSLDILGNVIPYIGDEEPKIEIELGKLLGRLVDGAIVRIGNAAQTLHPVAGQGLNLGLRDAMALVQGLRQAGPAPLATVLRRLEWSRGPDRWAMIAATDFLARSFTWGWPGLPAARGLGLAALQRLGPVKSALARQMMFGRR
jgi:aspartate-semialdehyde dehydrogenase